MSAEASHRKRVDFYVLGQGDTAHFACRLAEKITSQGHRVDVLAGSDVDARRLDELMWTFKQDSFVPHALAQDATAHEPVVIHGMAEPAGDIDVLINLSGAVPACAARCGRIAEVLPPEPEARRAGRERFRHYREQGFDLGSHNV